MKRLWVVFVIMVSMLLISSLALWHLSITTDQMLTSLEQISAAVEQENAEEIKSLTAEFIHEWHKNEVMLMRYMHHESLDAITGAAARLPALAKYEQYPELAAEVERVQTLIYHVYKSEIPNWKNIF